MNNNQRKSTGRKLSEETKTKISAKAKGRKLSEETKAKILATKKERGTLKKGEEHYNWKGGKPWERFRNPLYQQWRSTVLERDSYTCQDCGCVKKRYDRGLTAHHIKPYSTHPDLRFEVSNGVTLCRKCHMAVHGKNISEVELIPCACGCGTLIKALDPYHKRPRKYVNGHFSRGRSVLPESIQKMREAKQGKTLTAEHRAKISDGFRKGDSSTFNYPTMKEQNRHRNNNRMVEYRGETKCIAEWSEIMGIHHATITTRLKNGWDIEDALTTPASKKNSKRRKKN